MFTSHSIHVLPGDRVDPNATNTGISISERQDGNHQVDIFFGNNDGEIVAVADQLIEAIQRVRESHMELIS